MLTVFGPVPFGATSTASSALASFAASGSAVVTAAPESGSSTTAVITD